MTSNLKLALKANNNYIGSNNDGSIFTFNTGNTCATDGQCMLNGNTVSTEGVTNGGYYYSWYAATGNTGFTTSGENNNAQGSICPMGWRLPANYTVAPDKSFGGLTKTYLGFSDNTTTTGYSTLEAQPMSFVRIGNYSHAHLDDRNNLGRYWSSTTNSDGNVYFIRYSTSYIWPQQAVPKFLGQAIRCVAI